MSSGVESVSGFTRGTFQGGWVPMFGLGALDTIDTGLIEAFGAACLFFNVAVGVAPGDLGECTDGDQSEKGCFYNKICHLLN